MTINGRPVSWGDLIKAIAVLAAVALWAWGTGYWMGSQFVPTSAFRDLEQRVLKIERAK